MALGPGRLSTEFTRIGNYKVSDSATSSSAAARTLRGKHMMIIAVARTAFDIHDLHYRALWTNINVERYGMTSSSSVMY